MEYLSGCNKTARGHKVVEALQKPINVLHVIRQGKVGGGESYVMDLTQNLNNAKFTSTVLAFTPGEMVQRLQKLGVDVHVIEVKFPGSKHGAVKRLIKERNIDIIHAHGTKAGLFMLLIRLFSKLPFIYTIHGFSYHEGQSKLSYWLRQQFEKLLNMAAHKTILGSYANCHQGRQELALENTTVIQNAISLDRLREKEANAQPLSREELGIPAAAFLVTYLARVTLQKNPEVLMEAFAKLLKNVPSAYLLMVGDGELLDTCKALAKQYGYEDKVHFAGQQTDVSAYLNLADVYVLPSLWEVLSLSLMEAMALAVPCVASDIDSNKELIKEGENGYLFKLGDAVSLSQTLTKVYAQPEERKLMAQAGKDLIVQHFTFERIGVMHQSLYQQIINQRRAKSKV